MNILLLTFAATVYYSAINYLTYTGPFVPYRARTITNNLEFNATGNF